MMGTKAAMVLLPPPEGKEERGAVLVLLAPLCLHRGLSASLLGRVVVVGTCLAPTAARGEKRTRVERQLAAAPGQKVRLKLIDRALPSFDMVHARKCFRAQVAGWSSVQQQ